jgi:hypothetical protein
LAHARDEEAAALEPLQHALPLRRPIQHEQRDDRRAQMRIALDVPHEGVGVAQSVVELLRHQPPV